jgi:hypothetical protein
VHHCLLHPPHLPPLPALLPLLLLAQLLSLLLLLRSFWRSPLLQLTLLLLRAAAPSSVGLWQALKPSVPFGLLPEGWHPA